MGKGTNRRGSIYQDKNGQWWAQLPPDAMGKRPKRSAKSEEDAVFKLTELEAERSRGLNPSEKQPTVEQWLRTWLELVKPGLRSNIYEHYVYVVGHYIVPHIGRVKLKELTKGHVQAALNTLREGGLSAGTVRLARTRLRSALEEAIEAHKITENVAKKTKVAPDDDDDSEMHILTIGQVRTFLTAITDHRLYALFYLALATGMRQAEMIGLRWSDIKFDERTIRVASQVHRRHKGIVRSRPKTPASRRTLPIDDELLAVLKSHQQNQNEEKRLLGTAWHEHTMVFASEVGTPLFASALHRQFKSLLRAARLPDIRFHDLRHTAASLMLAAGVPLPDVSEMLGHANAGITAKLYLHGSDDGKKRAIETMGQLFKRAAL